LSPRLEARLADVRWSIVFAFAAVYLIWGSTYLAIRFALETLPPFLMAGLRLAGAGAVLYAWTRARGAARPTLPQWRAAAIVGFLLLVGGNGGVVWAELRVPSGLTALLVSMVPVWVVVLEWVGPRSMRLGMPGRPVLIGVVGGLIGVALLVGPGDLLGGAVDPLGAGVLMVASLSWAFGSILSRKLPLPSSASLATAMEMLAGGGALLLLGLVLGEGAELDLARASARSILALVYLAVFGSLVGLSAYVYLLREVAVSKVATYAYVNPIVALLLGSWMAQEELSPRALLAAITILGSVVLITTYRRSPRVAPASELPGGDAVAPGPPSRTRRILRFLGRTARAARPRGLGRRSASG
jgi:drug/metabolite transporter (DMT)-like permease